MPVQKSIRGNLDGLAGLAGLADHSGLDIRPTLLRVLTDLYVQKPSHSPDEERHYVELALRLIEEVDAGTCAAVAASLAHYPAAPDEVMQRLAPIAALRYPKPSTAKLQDAPIDEDADLFEPVIAGTSAEPATVGMETENILQSSTDARQSLPAPLATPEPVDFAELRNAFFDADVEARRAILTNLEFVAIEEMPALASGTNVMRYLEQAALAGRRQEFTTLLQQALGVSRALAIRIVSDPAGEPFLVASRALAMPSEIFQRILMFLNPEIGQSVQRVYELADLFFELPQDSALYLVSIWRAADRAEARASLHRPLHWPDGKSARTGSTPSRKPGTETEELPGPKSRQA